MLARLRRFRWVAALLAVLSPPAAGSVIPVIDPCPVDMPWAVSTPDASGGEHAAHGAEHPAEQPSSGHHSTCHCISACTGATGVAHPATGPAVVASRVRDVRTRSGLSLPVVRLERPRFLLPPAHAPPLV